jgi:hypothetical protein
MILGWIFLAALPYDWLQGGKLHRHVKLSPSNGSWKIMYTNFVLKRQVITEVKRAERRFAKENRR